MSCPQATIIQEKRNYLKMEIKDIDLSILNSLRRIMISGIKTLAFDYLIIETNDSNMPDEMLSHRIGLIPITVPQKTVLIPSDKCVCEFECPICTVKFECNVANVKEQKMIVSSRDLVPDNKWNISSFSCNDQSVDDTFYPIPILQLDPNKKLKFQAIAKLGIGKDHAKWSPVSIATFFPLNDAFIFLLETNGSYHPMDIFDNSIRVLIDKLSNILL